MKITKVKIEELATRLVKALKEREISDTIVYYNNKRVFVDYGYKKDVTEEDVNPHDYFGCAYEHILSMSFEGGLYDEINYGDAEWLSDLFAEYGCYFEQWDAWNLTLYPNDDNMEIEYTYYPRPKEKICIYSHNLEKMPYGLQLIKTEWDRLSKETENLGGSCTIGDGFEFTYGEDDYWMATPNIQGSLAYEKHIPEIKKMLENLGATNVHYNYGRLD